MTKQEINKRYYYRHKDRVIAATMKWRKDNPEKYRATARAAGKRFNKTPKGIYHAMKNNSRKRGMEFTLSQEEFLVWYDNTTKTCLYCDKPEEVEKRLEIDRMDNNKGYELKNITLACADCNGVKGNILTMEEMLIIGDIIMKKRWQQ